MGLSFSKNNRAHSASVKYVSKMEEKLHEQGTRQQYEEGQYSIQSPMGRYLTLGLKAAL